MWLIQLKMSVPLNNLLNICCIHFELLVKIVLCLISHTQYTPEFVARLLPMPYRPKNSVMQATVWRSTMNAFQPLRIWLRRQIIHSGIYSCVATVPNDALYQFAIANTERTADRQRFDTARWAYSVNVTPAGRAHHGAATILATQLALKATVAFCSAVFLCRWFVVSTQEFALHRYVYRPKSMDSRSKWVRITTSCMLYLQMMPKYNTNVKLQYCTKAGVHGSTELW